MNTAEKIQVTVLFGIFLFLSYITVYTVRQTLEWQGRPRRVFLPKAKAQTQMPEKGAKLPHAKKSQDLFTSGKSKTSANDCEGANKDLDSCKQK